MKKLWLMLLIGCTVGAFSACSDGEDDPKPTNPITEYTVPATAEIGGFYTVAGKGFAASAQLYLRNASGVETATTDPTVASTGITVAIPSTLTAGVYTVVVKQDGSWDLGQVRLNAAQNPVSSVVLPAAIKLNQPLEIAGNGFTADSKIILKAPAADRPDVELTTAVSPTGVTCTIPSGVAAGTYNVILKQNNIDWTLSETAIPAAVYKRLKEIKISSDDTYHTEQMDIEGLLAMGFSQSDIDDLIGLFQMMSGSSVAADELYVYNAEGRVTAVQKPDAQGAMAEWFVFSYEGDKVSATNSQFEGSGDKSFVWTMNDGLVESANVDFGSRSYDFNWSYDTDGYWTGTAYATNSKPYAVFEYANGNLSKVGISSGGMAIEMFKYENAELKNNIFGIDVAKALLHQAASGSFATENLLFANALGFAGKTSVNMPSGLILSEESTVALTYTYDADGYATSVKWSATGMDQVYGICPTESAKIIEFIYE